MNLIIPAAGYSSRFPKMRPKWMLTHPRGSLMLAEAISGLKIPDLQRVYLTVLRTHVEEYHCLDGIKKQFEQIGLADKLTLLMLDQPTRSQPETIARTITENKIRGPICIKDSDNFFRLDVPSRNFVSVVDLNNVGYINPSNKSYATVNDRNLVTNIAEKRVISNYFCSGAYGFAEADEYLHYYRALEGLKDLYVSHIIYQMILENKAFAAAVGTEYSDWGTLKDWNRYKAQFATLFVDLDGTLVRNAGEYFDPTWGQTDGIPENIGILNRLYESGRVHIVITTSRKEAYRDVTLKQLARLGIKFHQIVFGLNHGRRIVINDYARTNPFKSCDAVNLARDDSNLAELLEAVLLTDGDA